MNMPIKTSFGINNGYAPAEGPKTLPLKLDFGTVSEIRENFFLEHSEGHIQFFQSIWIDNNDNLNDFEVITNSGQRIICAAGGQGAFPLIHQLPGDLVFRTSASANLFVNVQLLNVPLASYQSGPISVSANISPIARGVLADASGAIALGGTSQVALAANAARQYLLVQNPANAIEVLLLNFGAAAAAGNSIELLPGDSYETKNFVSTQSINVNAATTAHAFIIKEG